MRDLLLLCVRTQNLHSMPLAPLAQLVELRTFNPQVMGSSPIGRTLRGGLVLAFLQHMK